MKTLALAFLTAIASSGVVASEVGASYPQLAGGNATNVAVAIAETGASTSWATKPFENMATAKQTRELNDRVEGINAQMNIELEALIAEKLEQSLSNK